MQTNKKSLCHGVTDHSKKYAEPKTRHNSEKKTKKKIKAAANTDVIHYIKSLQKEEE